MNDTQTCPNCPSSPTGLVFALASGVRVVACRSCGLQFAERYPTYGEADRDIYEDDYFSAAIADSEHRERVFAELLSEIESVAAGRGRLLDIGTGEGTLLKVAAGRGWQAEGTEISSAMVRHARESGLTVHHGAVEDIPLPAASYDAAVLNHVLEHVKNPLTTLARVRELLRSPGIVRVEVPNLASLSSRLKNTQSRLGLKRNPWKHYSTGHHFWFFTPATLEYTLRSSGFSGIAISSPAKQWGKQGWIDRASNRLYRVTHWGGHIVAFAHRRSGDGKHGASGG
jgi:2-polyprenyl-3-methyl-5-hydroxy-6-metoxy-1,4-benzoquinol methylase